MSKTNTQNGMKFVNVNSDCMKVFATINNIEIKINEDVNIQN